MVTYMEPEARVMMRTVTRDGGSGRAAGAGAGHHQVALQAACAGPAPLRRAPAAGTGRQGSRRKSARSSRSR